MKHILLFLLLWSPVVCLAQNIYVLDADSNLIDSFASGDKIIYRSTDSKYFNKGSILYMKSDSLYLDNDSIFLVTDLQNLRHLNRSTALVLGATNGGIKVGGWTQKWLSLAAGITAGIVLYQPNLNLVYVVQYTVLVYSSVHFVGYAFKTVSRLLHRAVLHTASYKAHKHCFVTIHLPTE